MSSIFVQISFCAVGSVIQSLFGFPPTETSVFSCMLFRRCCIAPLYASLSSIASMAENMLLKAFFRWFGLPLNALSDKAWM